MTDLRERRSEGAILPWAVRRHGQHEASDRELEEMLVARGVRGATR